VRCVSLGPSCTDLVSYGGREGTREEEGGRGESEEEGVEEGDKHHDLGLMLHVSGGAAHKDDTETLDLLAISHS